MTNDDMKKQIADAAVERKECLDKISCYAARLKNARHGIDALLSEQKNPLHEDNQAILSHGSDPREDARGYVEAVQRSQELADFLRTHNAL